MTKTERYRNGIKEMIDGFDSQFFATFTTNYPLELHRCHKLMKRYCDSLIRYKPAILWFAERFTDRGRGYHIHAVIKFGSPCKPIDVLGTYYLEREWQSVADIHRTNSLNISQVRRFEAGRATADYLTKEIEDSTQWGILPDY